MVSRLYVTLSVSRSYVIRLFEVDTDFKNVFMLKTRGQYTHRKKSCNWDFNIWTVFSPIGVYTIKPPKITENKTQELLLFIQKFWINFKIFNYQIIWVNALNHRLSSFLDQENFLKSAARKLSIRNEELKKLGGAMSVHRGCWF